MRSSGCDSGDSPLRARSTRRQVLGALAGLALPASAQPVHYREYARCLPDYLTALAEDAYNRRKARVRALKSRQAVGDYQSWARSTFLRLIGPLPERTPLNIRTVGQFERERYRVEKLVYESRPGLFVTANLYLPKLGAAPYPGVLFQMGHSNNGKGSALYQRCCQGLVQLGYLVLAFDPMGQGERTNYPQEGGWLTRLPSADEEHTVPGRQMLLVGETATAFQLWDAMRSLDVLASHPQVDPQRLASTGQSGGGTLTMLLAAADERLAAAAVSSGNTENFATRPFFSPGSTDDAEQDLIGSGPLAFDRWDLLWPIAPKPLHVAVSAHDFFGTYSPAYEISGLEGFSELERGYGLLGAADHLKRFETPLPHALSYSMRLAIYNWFERFLKKSGRQIEDEPPTNPERDETLWCGPSGNTIRDFHGKTPHSLLLESAAAIRTPDAPADLRKLLGMEPSGPPARLEIRGRTRYADCDIVAAEVQTAAQVWSPSWLFLPKRSWTRLLLVIEPNGRNGRWREGDLYSQLVASGIAVCAQDVRGVGDLEPQFSPGAAGYERGHHSEENHAWASLMLGHSLLGQRATDILKTVESLAGAYPQASIAVAARDRMTVPALCAAALDARISKLYLAGHLVSWRALLQPEIYSHPFANFVPNVLRFTDLPQIARSLEPRSVVVAGAVDAAGNPARDARTLYRDYHDRAEWNLAALSAI